ncbi:MAG: DUF4230 domain-containing protein [Coriobacteriia bacterium]|nr:DUF4230 domain-containing protein [Coriobacteriia bacterium]
MDFRGKDQDGQPQKPDPAVEQQIRLQEAERKRAEAETKRIKAEARKSRQEDRRERAAERRTTSKNTSFKTKLIGGAIAIVALILVFGVAVPILLDKSENEYSSTSALKEAVNISSLSTVEYMHNGIAEHHTSSLFGDAIDYRVKYKAFVRAEFDMSTIEFAIDNESKTITAFLPEPVITAPTLDETELDYMPRETTVPLKDTIALCREDIICEMNTGLIQEEATNNLHSVIEALTAPLVEKDWTIKYKSLSEYSGENEEGGSGEAK